MNTISGLNIIPRQDITLVTQLKQQITWLIASGKLKQGHQLPPVKELAAQLGINLHTVRSAYLKLAADGLVETRQGRGTHVLSFDREKLAQIAGTARTYTMGVILPSWTNPFYHSVLQGIEEVSDEEQTLIFLCNTHDDPCLAMRSYAQLAAKQVDGIIVISQGICSDIQPDTLKKNQDNRLPVVSIDWPGCKGYSVNVDLKMAGYQATEHLINHGHRRIGLITSSVDGGNISAINEGYTQALRKYDIAFNPELMEYVSGFDMNSGISGARTLLKKKDAPTAIFAIGDVLCLGAMQAIIMSGLRVPQDVALIGFNDISVASLVYPPLTTISFPSVQIGREAMHILQLLITGEQPPQRQLILSTTLIKRESCGCPRKDG